MANSVCNVLFENYICTIESFQKKKLTHPKIYILEVRGQKIFSGRVVSVNFDFFGRVPENFGYSNAFGSSNTFGYSTAFGYSNAAEYWTFFVYLNAFGHSNNFGYSNDLASILLKSLKIQSNLISSGIRSCGRVPDHSGG